MGRIIRSSQDLGGIKKELGTPGPETRPFKHNYLFIPVYIFGRLADP